MFFRVSSAALSTRLAMYAEPPSLTMSYRKPAASTSVHASSQAALLNLPLEASRRRNARYSRNGSLSADKKR